MTKDPRRVVIISVPYCEPFLLVAPVLLAACLEQKGISAKGIDFNAMFLHKIVDRPYYTHFKNLFTTGHMFKTKMQTAWLRDIIRSARSLLLEIYEQHRPEYIGLSIFTSESQDFGLLLSYLIRRHLPDVKIIAGGKGLEVSDVSGSKIYQQWIQHAVADVVVVGDAEHAIADVILNNHRGVVHAPLQTKQDLDAVPLAKWYDLDFDLYDSLSHMLDGNFKSQGPYLTVTSSKGCVRKCSFCDVASFWPEFLYRDPVRVAEEIIHNHRATGIRRFLFTDNLINGSVKNYRTMNQKLSAEIPGQIEYGGYAIFRGQNQMPEQDFELAAQAGCRLWQVGIESGSERIRHDMKKKFSNKDLDWSINMLYKYGIMQTWLLMVGYPSETHEDFLETERLILRYAHLNDRIQIQVTPPFMLLGNSPLLTDTGMRDQYGLAHVVPGPMSDKFWTSTRYSDNTFAVRSTRWRRLLKVIQEQGYAFGPGMPTDKWLEEVDQLDNIYDKQHTKVVPIRPA